MNSHQNKAILSVVVAVSMVSLFGFAEAATVVSLGSASSFAVLGASTVTSTGSSIVTGDLGLSPGTSVTGFPPATLNGVLHVADTSSLQAQADLTTAYNNASGQASTASIPTELGGTTRTPGVYDSASGDFALTGTLTLDAQGDPNAVFIFRTNSTLITAGGSTIVLANGAQACNVFWRVGSSATLGAGSSFQGSILAFTSVTLTTGASVQGRALARNGAVTLDGNIVTQATCAIQATPVPTPAPTPSLTPTPTIIVSPTPTISATPTPSSSPVPTSTVTPSLSPTGSPSPMPTGSVIPLLPSVGTPPDSTPLWPLIAGLGLVSFVVVMRRVSS